MIALEFEKPIAELEGKIAELRNMTSSKDFSIAEEISRLETKAEKLMMNTYGKLTAAQKMQVARHSERPHFSDYIKGLITDFTPLAGDRNFGEDHAMIGGLGRFNGRSVVVMGQEKGSDTTSRIQHNFGMARPEGYRKAIRLMEMASQFQLPVLTLVDTAGAYPGVDAEARGQAEAIAQSIDSCLRLRTPMISVVIGEGGSGGAIAIATADRVYMLEHSIYSVISPEGCASILWRSSQHAEEAAAALKLTAQDLLSLKLIDAIIPEPLGGAHRQRAEAIATVGQQIERGLTELSPWDSERLLKRRRQKYLSMGRA
ncbi:MAG: acetyl-CoA carboxylase carboxyltransferase subunit alpha [Alphaproteobacteria bacterium]|nr:acetyl-CoA carboxylase carboxyltransferase subunit alpha [Alphaproteobacteria bacterium]OIN86480.1 MAG: acetyl-CoA carboxylase carboxyltransferase subunit alpha [Alphaproteobacteria bacterium CG1_02_46_17]